jgi:hypothetical protein
VIYPQSRVPNLFAKLLILKQTRKDNIDMIKKNMIILCTVFSMAIITACSGLSSAETPAPEDIASDEEFLQIVSATGVIVPVNWARLSMTTPGVVEDVLVTEDEFVNSGQVFVHPGKWVNAGQPIVLLADTNNLQVETTDLSEIDLAQLNIGDSVIVPFDALPDVLVNSTVKRIASKAAEGAGVNYPVTIELNEIPDLLRWGMTAFVDIQVVD